MADLFTIARTDSSTILNLNVGPGRDVTVIDPDGLTAVVRGVYTDVALQFDPDTGMMVANRETSVAFNVGNVVAAGFTNLPDQVADTRRKPWVLLLQTVDGKTQVFKVARQDYDRTLGIILCFVELYRDGKDYNAN